MRREPGQFAAASGKELSYNNLLDLDSALAIVRVLAGPSVGGDQT